MASSVLPAAQAEDQPVREQYAHLLDLITVNREARERIPVHAPFTGERIGTLPACTGVDVDAALERARQAQQDWSARALSERKAILLRYHDLLLEKQDTLADLIQLESGKARLHAWEEVLDGAINCRHYAHRARRYLRPKRRKGALPLLTTTREYHHPIGVVGYIAPWNYPLSLAIGDAVPALLAGNAVILKPAEQTSYTALFALALLREAGLPADVFQIVTGYGQSIGPPLIAGVNFLCFTGSTATGRIVAAQAGEHLIKCSLELGGKNAALILNDADLRRAVPGLVRGCFTNAGQLCLSFERLYVQSGIYDQFLDAFVERVRAMRIDASADYDTDMGSLISQDQFAKVEKHVADARAKGVTILTGGNPRPDLGPFFYEPTVLTDVTPDMALAREETFGPVVAVYRFDEVADAVSLANDTSYGLNAGIWTRDTRAGFRLAQAIRAGTVNINESYVAAWGSVDAPMGGMKASGIGRRHGAEGFLKYTESQTVAAQHLFNIAPLPGMPGSRFTKVMTTALRILKRIPGLR